MTFDLSHKVAGGSLRFRRYALIAADQASNAAATSMPASFNPKDSPPQPANRSTALIALSSRADRTPASEGRPISLPSPYRTQKIHASVAKFKHQPHRTRARSSLFR